MILFFRFTHRFFFFGIFARYTNAIIWRYFFFRVCARIYFHFSIFMYGLFHCCGYIAYNSWIALKKVFELLLEFNLKKK